MAFLLANRLFENKFYFSITILAELGVKRNAMSGGGQIFYWGLTPRLMGA